MSLDPDKQIRLEELLDAIFEERAGDADFEALGEMLQDDPETQQAYLERVDLHHSLKWQAAGDATYRSLARMKETPVVRPLPRWAGIAAAAAALVAIALLVGSDPAPSPPLPEGPPPVAVLMETLNATWKRGPMEPGTALPSGRLELLRGAAEVEFTGGARMLVQGPSVLTLNAPDRARLHQGKITVSAPAAPGFRLDAPGLEISNERSEFGLRVDGHVRLTVLEGEVEARVETEALQIPQTVQLTREESLHLDASGTLTANIVGASASFARVRSFSNPDVPRIANGSFEFPRTGSYPQLAAAGWRLEVHPLANLENMPVQTGAGVIGARKQGLRFTGPTPSAPRGRQWGFLNARTFPDGRTYHTSMHQAVGRLVPGATYLLTATVGRPEGAASDGPTYTLGLYAGTPESGPVTLLQEWTDPALPAPGQVASLRLSHHAVSKLPETGSTLFFRIATIPGPAAGTRQILIDDIRLERAP